MKRAVTVTFKEKSLFFKESKMNMKLNHISPAAVGFYDILSQQIQSVEGFIFLIKQMTLARRVFVA